MNQRVMTALSGGVDSTVCVQLLKEQGYEVEAVVMRMSPLHAATVEAAREAAEALKIPLTVLDLEEEFECCVVVRFVEEYLRGRTPNPCVMCNPAVKFRYLLKTMEEHGCAYAATGHYARIEQSGGEYQLKRAASLQRDQSYMRYRLGQYELSHLMFPLAEMEKPAVRELARSAALSASEKPDSQENCFIEGKDYAAFLERRTGALPEGEIIAPDGSVCGRHRGIARYTVGQRKGLGIALGRPVFVKRIDAEENRIYLADAGEEFVSEAKISDVTTISGRPLPKNRPLTAKIRSMARPVPARVVELEGTQARIRFDMPERAVAPGQSLVLYDGEVVLGGGYIE